MQEKSLNKNPIPWEQEKENQIRISFLNIMNLKNNYDDIAKDTTLMRSTILAISETWLNINESIECLYSQTQLPTLMWSKRKERNESLEFCWGVYSLSFWGFPGLRGGWSWIPQPLKVQMGRVSATPVPPRGPVSRPLSFLEKVSTLYFVPCGWLMPQFPYW